MTSGVLKTDLPVEEQKKCEVCSACTKMRGKKGPLDVCLLKNLEIASRRVPSYLDTQQNNIDMSKVPEGCPRGYVSSARREIR